ncbi:spore germination protein [Lysinibacillus sp. MHQ-1]|nr:spore germination protein [Lysinibacillus sp. MHQ-1]
MELSNQVKNDVNEIPYRPLIEALILEIIMELIRESSIRLPQSVGQTIGIVGGLVIGDAIVSAGLVSNLMVIVVALTAISSYVVPSVELNSTIRMIRFPFMVLASLFGFLGIVVGVVILLIHLINLTSLKQPYFFAYHSFSTEGCAENFFYAGRLSSRPCKSHLSNHQRMNKPKNEDTP